MTPQETEVIVVGAGPTGLMLAGDLAESGVHVTVLEKRGGESNLTRAFAVHARTLEMLDARGIADDLIATGTTQPRLQLLGRVDLDLSRLPSRYPFVLITPQYHTERILRDRAERAGAVIVHEAELTALAHDDTGVTATTTAGRYRGRYLVGTDGAHSAVRRLLALPFPGRFAVERVTLADVTLTRPPARPVTLVAGPAGFGFTAPFGDGRHRFLGRRTRTPRTDAPPTLDEVRSLIIDVFGADLGLTELHWSSRFDSEERQVPHYRVGRVLLAGDAAHVHSPAGGQGMNLGIQDAANLSWKLAAVVGGWAPDRLLDSYHAERHPVGRTVLMTTGVILRLALLRSPVVRRLRDTAATTALRTATVSGRVTGMVSGLAVRYPAPPGAHRRVGERVPDLAVETRDGPAALYRRTAGRRFVLVSPTATTPAWPPPEHLDVVAPAADTGRAILVRPDGHLAWVGHPDEAPTWAYRAG
ncbi:2-polyprenyl-6-methoxyphenol hydroxylase-like FAD-dependent oxidoreductase [Stackebrandtia albiflava]|uniref:2-polyprenyl-6-methoxyphenol hydroxylase-like FAD-dependent oxidoreductase n=1 Tax=Stackebrandtia albiflava TaxID=406432 RepID=A0A562V3T2_9ACTN|nr:FAD-dependent monooxygenase [Stackebrandtia albiflava]TWJ12536.1 2-polyprenyl-6-methoxyphenol hydroxylase-like FAD-dependent oxidoreductase [Stackebrandtia albiflava]